MDHASAADGPGNPDASARATSALSLGVLICSYRRPDALRKCLEGLARLSRPPDDVIVVCRRDDEPTRACLAGQAATGLPLRVVLVSQPGIVAARNAGHDACRTDILSSIDDDVVPHSEWLSRIECHFLKDPRLGGLGGRDHVHDGERFDERLADSVGRLSWYGRTVGNHHLGWGKPRDVQFLKGANMSFRATAMAGLRFDTRLCGRSIEAHEDLAFSLAVWSRGWRIAYDPAVLVFHYAGRAEKRAYSAISAEVPANEVRDAAFNKVIALWPAMTPDRRFAFAIWSTMVGTGVEPGLLQALRYTRRLRLASWRRLWCTLAGKYSAFALLLRQPRSEAARRRYAGETTGGANMIVHFRIDE
jgi:GT2 family glycosyltransferase